MEALQPMIDFFLQHPTIPLFLLLLIPRNTRNLSLFYWASDSGRVGITT